MIIQIRRRGYQNQQSGKGDDIKASIPALLLHGCNLSFKETCQFTLTLGGLLIHTVEILLVRDATNYLNPGMAFITTKIRRRGKRSNRLWLHQLPILKQLCLYLMQAHETDSKQNISKMLLFLQPHEQLTHILLIQQQ